MSDDDLFREAMKEAYIEGYKAGRNVESYSKTTLKTAEGKFDRWYKMNFERSP